MDGVVAQTITPEFRGEALDLCQRFLGGQWNNVSLDEFKIKPLSGGFSNLLYHCSLPENKALKDSKVPNEVLLRIYGVLQEDTGALTTGLVIFMLLAAKNLGPKLYGVFPQGRLEEYIPSRILNSEDIRRYSTSIARQMAKIHALNVPLRKVPDTVHVIATKWLKELKEHATAKNDIISVIDTFDEEMEWLRNEMEKSDSPVTFCHNDLQGGNILLRLDKEHADNEEPEIVLIDFEFGFYNYRGFDLANHFVEWCMDYNTPEYPHFTCDPNKFPTQEEQISYIEAYLDQLQKEGVTLNRPMQRETYKLLDEIKLFSAACCLYWSLWSIKMTLSSMTEACDFAFKEHAKIRRKLYFIYKEQYLKTFQCNGDVH